MRLTIHLHTILQRQTADGPVSLIQMEMPDGSTLADLLAALGVVVLVEETLLVVNQHHAEPETALHDGDRVDLIPALSGG